MDVQPFLVPGASQREQALRSLRADAEKWLAGWVGEERASAIAIELREGAGDEQTDGIGFVGDDDGGRSSAWAVCTATADSLAQLGATLLGGCVETNRQGGQIARRFALTAMRKLVQTWTGQAALTSRQGEVAELIPSTARQPGCGVLGLSVQISETAIDCWLPLQALHTRLDTGGDTRREDVATPVPIAQAVGGQGVSLRAMLGQVDLSLDALSRLQPGDVITLDKAITAPLALCMRNSDVGFSGYLGKQQDRLAFRVVEKLAGNDL